MEKKIFIKEEFIRLDSFLKLCGAAGTGGQAKLLILDGHASVNGEVCTMRGKKIYPGGKVLFDGDIYVCDKAGI